jgi:hypothetical protein
MIRVLFGEGKVVNRRAEVNAFLLLFSAFFYRFFALASSFPRSVLHRVRPHRFTLPERL